MLDRLYAASIAGQAGASARGHLRAGGAAACREASREVLIDARRRRRQLERLIARVCSSIFSVLLVLVFTLPKGTVAEGPCDCLPGQDWCH